MLHKLMHHPLAASLRQPKYRECAVFILRLALGAIFMYHGYGKLTGLAGVTGFFGKIGIPMPGLMAPFIAGLEFFGGALIILGLAVRPVALLLAGTMLVAILKAKGLVWAKIEFEVALLAMSLSLFLSGAGACSLDARCMKQGAKEHEGAMPIPKA